MVTDGAFPTRGTMHAYILPLGRDLRLAPGSSGCLPAWIYIVRRLGRPHPVRRGGSRCRYPDIERAVARLAPRPWLMIHGAKDTYIGPEIARRLFARAGDPKEFWLVPGAKHNRCREVEPEAYAERISTSSAATPLAAPCSWPDPLPGPPALAEPPRLDEARLPEAPVAEEVAVTVSG